MHTLIQSCPAEEAGNALVPEGYASCEPSWVRGGPIRPGASQLPAPSERRAEGRAEGRAARQAQPWRPGPGARGFRRASRLRFASRRLVRWTGSCRWRRRRLTSCIRPSRKISPYPMLARHPQNFHRANPLGPDDLSETAPRPKKPLRHPRASAIRGRGAVRQHGRPFGPGTRGSGGARGLGANAI